jgi:hypothetical protein
VASVLCLIAADAIAAISQGFDENFDLAPTNAWKTWGDASLFAWDSSASALRVTWDSRRPNSYFARPLGTVLNRRDDFQVSFTLELDHVEVGVNPGKPFTFELAVGLLNWQDATSPAFRRGTGSTSPNLVELDYFPDSGYGATVWPTFVSREGRWNYNGSDDFTLLELERGARYRVELDYSAKSSRLRTSLWREGTPVGPVKEVRLASRFTDYAVDTFAVCSYSDDGAQGSLLAGGIVDDVRVRVPPPPLGPISGSLAEGTWRVRFEALTNWVYVLEQSADLDHWEGSATNVVEASGPLLFESPATPGSTFYRVQAVKP